MKTKIFALSMLLGLPVLGCDSSNTGDYTYVVYDLAVPDGSSTTLPPVPPFIGTQIDRMGRPGISALLLDPFDLVTGKNQGQVQDAYNAATSETDQQAGWPSFAPRPYIAENLAVWDGVDGNCGNQLMAATAVQPSRYLALATLLSADYLVINSAKATCSQYLAVEQGSTTDCGGRPPNLPTNTNVVDVTLNLLQGGNPPLLPLSTGVVTDGDGAPGNSTGLFLLPPT